MIRRLFPALLVLVSSFASAAEELRGENDVVYARFGDREVSLDWTRPDDEEVRPGVGVDVECPVNGLAEAPAPGVAGEDEVHDRVRVR